MTQWIWQQANWPHLSSQALTEQTINRAQEFRLALETNFASDPEIKSFLDENLNFSGICPLVLQPIQSPILIQHIDLNGHDITSGNVMIVDEEAAIELINRVGYVAPYDVQQKIKLVSLPYLTSMIEFLKQKFPIHFQTPIDSGVSQRQLIKISVTIFCAGFLLMFGVFVADLISEKNSRDEFKINTTATAAAGLALLLCGVAGMLFPYQLQSGFEKLKKSWHSTLSLFGSSYQEGNEAQRELLLASTELKLEV